jgi:BirA family transcriptional regulator, biotin operon repressor / biotin---[acetyl-CoA-carboxylase] ligase
MASEKYNIVSLAETGSTNLHASALLSDKKISRPSIIIAGYQNQGRGQGENSWESDPGENLLFSIVRFPENIKAFEQFYISKITSISVRETISRYTLNSKIKWPNDILVRNEKVSGILIENTIEDERIRESIIGIGININQTLFKPHPVVATSLKLLTGKSFSLELILENFMENFEFWNDKMEGRDFNQIDNEYYRYLYGFQKKLKFLCKGKVFEALISDVEKDGQLVLLLENNKKQKFGSKEVEFMMDDLL